MRTSVTTVRAEPKVGGKRTRGASGSTFAVMVTALIALVAVTVVAGLVANHGAFVYPLDDTYIHLDVARSLAQHGTWGISPGHYQSASSSPLWTLLLAASIFVSLGHGVLLAPIALATASSIWALWSMSKLLAAAGLARRPRPMRIIAGLLSAITLVPMSLLGMEHALHVALLLAILVAALPMFNGTIDRRGRFEVAFLLVLASLCRYETVFLAAGLATTLLVRKPPTGRRRLADIIAVITTPFLGIGAIGLINMAMGQGLLPDSVAAKSTGVEGQLTDLGRLIPRLAWTVGTFPFLVLITAAAVLVAMSSRRSSRRWFGLAATLSVMAICQTIFFKVANSSVYFFRYEAYLATCAVAILISWLLLERRDQRGLVVGFIGAVILLTELTCILQIVNIPAQSHEIYRQQQQVAIFLERAAPTTPVAINDLGQIAFRHPAGVVDLKGLGSHDVLQLARAHPLTAQDVDHVTRSKGVKVAAIYTNWFSDAIPAGWTPITNWCLTGKIIVVGERCVTFFATTTDEIPKLRTELNGFQPLLPDGVVVIPPGLALPPR